MASGTISFADNGTMRGRITWSSTTNIEANTSNVSVKLQVRKGTGYTGTTGTFSGKVTIGSTSSDDSYYGTVESSWVTVVSYSKNISHNNDGSGTCYIYGKITGPSGTSLAGVSVSGSQTVTLDKIPRAGSITAAPNFNDEDNPQISYSNPAGSAATVEACISFDGSKDDISYRTISATGSSYTFNLTDAERNTLRNSIPNSNSRKVRFYVQTTIGETVYRSYLEKTFSIVNGSPTVNPTITDTNSVTATLTGDSNKLIRYFSNTAIKFGASAVKGASIASTTVTCGSAKLTKDGTINEVESGTFKFTVVDSRGNRTTKTITKSIVNYVNLTCGFANASFTTDGVIKFNIKGNYFDNTFGTTSNLLVLQYRYKDNSGSYGQWQTITPTISNNTYTIPITLSGLNYRSNYVVEAKAVDELRTITTSREFSCIPVFGWSKEDFELNVPLVMPNNNKIMATTTDGTTLNAFQPANQNNNLVIGYGGYENNIGATHIYGDTIRLYTNNDIEINGKVLGANKVLWQGRYYMTASHTINLSDNISNQLSGIVLVFSRYDVEGNVELNEHFSYHFYPKQMVALHEGNGSIFNMSTSNETFSASKYLYISDKSISGHENNNLTGTGATGVKYDNKRFVLRYVIGV
jgi:hypothetical protein